MYLLKSHALEKSAVRKDKNRKKIEKAKRNKSVQSFMQITVPSLEVGKNSAIPFYFTFIRNMINEPAD